MFTVPAPMVEIGDVNEIEVAWEVVFDPGGTDGLEADAEAGEFETAWEVVFDPTDIQMASFVMEDWQ